MSGNKPVQHIGVDANGRDADGESDFDTFASDWMVQAGYAKNIPVVLHYPDGRVRTGNVVTFTNAGIDFIKRTGGIIHSTHDGAMN